jgi:hypothetical protein
VSDGIRTRGHLDHNQVLYQLSYTHHAAPTRAQRNECIGRAGGPGNQAQASEPSAPPCSVASRFDVSESGPGWSTNTAAR